MFRADTACCAVFVCHHHWLSCPQCHSQLHASSYVPCPSAPMGESYSFGLAWGRLTSSGILAVFSCHFHCSVCAQHVCWVPEPLWLICAPDSTSSTSSREYAVFGTAGHILMILAIFAWFATLCAYLWISSMPARLLDLTRPSCSFNRQGHWF